MARAMSHTERIPMSGPDITPGEIEQEGKLKKNGHLCAMNCKGCLLSGTALLLGGLLALGVFTITVGHFLTAVDALSQADAIVVLGGDGGGYPRVQHAVALLNEGCAPVVVFSGGTIEQGSRGAEVRG